MLRNRNHGWLVVVTLCAVGCNGANPRIKRPELGTNPQLQRARNEAPDSPPPQILPGTHFAAGRMLEAQGQLGKAMEQYRRAIAVGHNHQGAYHHLGLILSKLQQHDEAITMLTKAVELSPDDAVTRNNLGFELMFKQQWAEATKHLTKALELEPRFARARINLGMTLSKVGRFDEALAHFRAVLPEQDAQYNLGLMYRAAQQYADAGAAFHRALERDPGFRAAQKQLDDMAPHLTSPTPSNPTVSAEVVAVAPVEAPEPAPAIVPTPATPIQVATAAPPDTPDVRTSNETIEPLTVDATTDIVVDRVDAPCDAPNDIDAMIADGTLPPAPINLIEERPEWLTGEPFDEELEERMEQFFHAAPSGVTLTDEPCEEEIAPEPDPIREAIAELNDAFVPVPDETAQMPFGSLNDEVARLDDEIRCLVEEAMDAMARSVDGRSEPTVFEPVSDPRVDDSIAAVVVTDHNEPVRPLEPAAVDPVFPLADRVPLHLRTPSTTRQQVVAKNITTVDATATERVAVAGMTDASLPLDWRSRMRNFERRHGVLRSELDCLEERNEELTAERLAAATAERDTPEPHNTPEPVVISVVDKPRSHAFPPVTRRHQRTRAPLTSAYEPVLPESVFAAPDQRAAEPARHAKLESPKRTVTVPRPAVEMRHDDTDVTATAPAASDVPTPIAAETSAREPRESKPTFTEPTFDWQVQFGDLEEMTAVTANEIRCWDEMKRRDDRFVRESDPKKDFRKDAARPVSYNSRRNPFQVP